MTGAEARGVTIPGDDVALEGVLSLPPARGPVPGVLLCHPHPLYGGNLDNHLLRVLAQCLDAAGLAALRFNFRGVGRSGGRHDGGESERGDVVAALRFLGAQAGVDRSRLGVLGYSFGAWVGLRAAHGEPGVGALLGISPPLALYAFDFLQDAHPPLFAAVGSRDDYCPREAFERWWAGLGGPKEKFLAEGEDHFWGGQVEALAASSVRFCVRHLGSRPAVG